MSEYRIAHGANVVRLHARDGSLLEEVQLVVPNANVNDKKQCTKDFKNPGGALSVKAVYARSNPTKAFHQRGTPLCTVDLAGATAPNIAQYHKTLCDEKAAKEAEGLRKKEEGLKAAKQTEQAAVERNVSMLDELMDKLTGAVAKRRAELVEDAAKIQRCESMEDVSKIRHGNREVYVELYDGDVCTRRDRKVDLALHYETETITPDQLVRGFIHAYEYGRGLIGDRAFLAS